MRTQKLSCKIVTVDLILSNDFQGECAQVKCTW